MRQGSPIFLHKCPIQLGHYLGFKLFLEIIIFINKSKILSFVSFVAYFCLNEKNANNKVVKASMFNKFYVLNYIVCSKIRI